jgi:hypothetical protein
MTSQYLITWKTLYYDKYEYEFGDGFYPVIEKNNSCSEETAITFLYNKFYNSWVQVDNINISGLDGDNGIKLLNIMNKKYNLDCISIKNINYSNIYPKTKY